MKIVSEASAVPYDESRRNLAHRKSDRKIYKEKSIGKVRLLD